MPRKNIDLGWTYEPVYEGDESNTEGSGVGPLFAAGGMLALALFLGSCSENFVGMVSEDTFWNECQKMSGTGDIWQGSIENGTIALNDSPNAQWYRKNCQ
jgi:hypothetical protein